MGKISTRECQVLTLAAEGHTDESIANELGISVATVRGYWLRVRSKLGGSSRAELVAQWIRASNDTDAARVSEEHSDHVRANDLYFQDVLDGERKAMDALLGNAPPEMREMIRQIRLKSDESLSGVELDGSGPSSH